MSTDQTVSEINFIHGKERSMDGLRFNRLTLYICLSFNGIKVRVDRWTNLIKKQNNYVHVLCFECQ